MVSSTRQVTIDGKACVGHGRCYALAPELFEPDEEGNGTVVGEVTDRELERKLLRAEENCPEGAVIVER